jgi:hypothetical protein
MSALPESGHSVAHLGCLLWADFVVEVGLEGRVGWADDFLRSRQGQRFAPAPYGAAALMHWKLWRYKPIDSRNQALYPRTGSRLAKPLVHDLGFSYESDQTRLFARRNRPDGERCRMDSAASPGHATGIRGLHEQVGDVCLEG